MYELKIFTGFVLPTSEIDSISLLFDDYKKAVDYAKVSIDQGYFVEISIYIDEKDKQ